MKPERLRIMAITNRLLCSHPLEEAAEELLAGGVTAIMLREKDLSPRDLFSLAIRLRRVCTEQGALFLVNHALDVAIAAGADGAHLGAASIPPAAARAMAPSPFVLGYSAHDADELRLAQSAGFDYATISPVFQPTSKEYTAPPLGLEGLRRAAAAASTNLPLVALGGITPGNAPDCLAAGAIGVAAIGAFFGSAEASRTVPRLFGRNTQT